MGLKIPLWLLQSFRPADKPRKSKASRGSLSDEEKVRLSERVWVQEDGEIYTNASGEMARLGRVKKGQYSCVDITLISGKRQRRFSVGRLVLFAWHGERLMQRCREAAAAGEDEYLYPDDYQAGHIDDHPDNNYASNIEPVTVGENIRQSFARPDRRSNAPARSRPVVIADVRSSASAQARAFPIGHVFPSSEEAARQTGIKRIIQSIKKGCFAEGVRFEAGVLESDSDPPSRVWFPSVESGKWCRTLGGSGIRASNDGWVWTKRGSLKSRGHTIPGFIYHSIQIGGTSHQVHAVIMRVCNGVFDERGEWVAQAVPKDADGKNFLCLHGGPGRASDSERRVGGYERNHLCDLRWGTRKDNAADIIHERARKRACDVV